MKRAQENPGIGALSNRVGEFIEYWGFKKIHGAIWTHLYLSPVPLTASHLISRLGVSKALISLTLKDLIEHRLIVQTEDGTRKKNKTYSANPDVFGVIRNILSKREAGLVANILEECEKLGQKTPDDPDLAGVDPERLENLADMTRTANAALRVLLSPPGISTELLRFLFLRK